MPPNMKSGDRKHSVKGLECWYWANTGQCRWNNTCKYAHHFTGVKTEMPQFNKELGASVAGNNSKLSNPVVRKWQGIEDVGAVIHNPSRASAASWRRPMIEPKPEIEGTSSVKNTSSEDVLMEEEGAEEGEIYSTGPNTPVCTPSGNQLMQRLEEEVVEVDILPAQVQFEAGNMPAQVQFEGGNMPMDVPSLEPQAIPIYAPVHRISQQLPPYRFRLPSIPEGGVVIENSYHMSGGLVSDIIDALHGGVHILSSQFNSIPDILETWVNYGSVQLLRDRSEPAAITTALDNSIELHRIALHRVRAIANGNEEYYDVDDNIFIVPEPAIKNIKIALAIGTSLFTDTLSVLDHGMEKLQARGRLDGDTYMILMHKIKEINRDMKGYVRKNNDVCRSLDTVEIRDSRQSASVRYFDQPGIPI